MTARVQGWREVEHFDNQEERCAAVPLTTVTCIEILKCPHLRYIICCCGGKLQFRIIIHDVHLQSKMT